jgi:hypothetical protein
MPSFTCTDGEVIELYGDYAGVDTGYGYIGNPYFLGDPNWRFKDGDTVIGCNADHPQAMLVQDAYQLWYENARAEQMEFDAMVEEWNRESDARRLDREESDRFSEMDRLYEIQDSLK